MSTQIRPPGEAVVHGVGRASLIDVASRAKVSTATVSRVFNRPHLVSVEARDRVRTAATELSYLPNAHARSLAIGGSWIVGLLTPTLSTAGVGQAVETLQAMLEQQRIQLLLSVCGEDPDRARLQARWMVEAGAVCLIELVEAAKKPAPSAPPPIRFLRVVPPWRDLKPVVDAVCAHLGC